MLITYTINGVPDLGSAVNVATKRALVDGSHASINSTKQVGPMSWEITMFVSNSQGVTSRSQARGPSPTR